MRLFATGALQWAMGRFDEDEAIEAKMVTKAVERAQTTVEQKNAEVRKNVLKYDEVMNEQRKIIYQRRDQILEGADLRSAAYEYLDDAVSDLVGIHCVSAATDEWDLDGLLKKLRCIGQRPQRQMSSGAFTPRKKSPRCCSQSRATITSNARLNLAKRSCVRSNAK